MEDSKVAKVSLTENIAERIARWAQSPEEDRIKYLKVKLGLETILINVTKGLIVYSVVLFLGLFWQVVVFHIGYYLIRRTANGIHATDSLICSVLSVIAFVGVPYIAMTYTLPIYIIPFLFIMNALLLYLFAPYVSKKNKHVHKHNRQKLRNQSIAMCFALLGITLLLPSETFQTILASGVTLASMLTIQKKHREEA